MSLKSQDVLVLLKLVARRDPELYELLVIADALRAGRTREKMVATKALKKTLKNYG